MFCKVYLFDAPYHIDCPFDYTAGENVRVGDIVKVPFGRANKLRYGVVAGLSECAEGENIKPVHSIVGGQFAFTPEMLGLCLFLKEYTLCTFGEAAKTLLPPGALAEKLNIRYTHTVSLKISADEALSQLSEKGRAGIRSEGQREVLRRLLACGELSDTELLSSEEPKITSQHLKALTERGVIEITSKEYFRNPYAEYAMVRDTSPINLTRAQTVAYDAIEELYLSGEAKAALLYGVTGSGKTKVIMKAIDRTVADGKSVIMMVPEIALTPQTVSIFCKRYGERVAVIHSSLSQGERLDAWRRIRSGEVDLVIGTRSAVFAPLSNIGMIVIDEEHEHTYKSESDPKYHARDVAAYRSGKHNALMLLASATPSVESFYKAEIGKYTLVPIRERYAGIKLPDAVIVDMREEIRLGNTSAISERLLRELEAVGEREEQAILFLNRRGYNSHVTCRACGDVITCPRCSVSLTYHTGRGAKLLCHLCGYQAPPPKICPSCSSDNIAYLGYGTQKVESELNSFLPDMPVMRMDADTTSGKLAYDRMLDDFREGRADILLGTQMVAKGHDFPRVTLVGAVLADTSLYLSDFRASERTFSLLTQVIGRAGRARDGGIAVIQTYAPKNEVIRLACLQDYDKFYEGEIAMRRELTYPPFCDMVAMTLTGSDERELFDGAKRLSDELIARLKGDYSGLPFTVFGPFEAQIYKLNEKFRMRMMLKCKLNATTRRMFSEILLEFAKDRKVTLAIDLNPLTV